MVTTNFPRSRNRAPDDTVWASIRDEFTQLYLYEGLPLKKISLTLAETRNFHAEPHMFKHRIKQWNLRKNFKLEELGAVAKAVEPFIQAGLQPPTAILDSRQVPLSRAKRHFKDSFQRSALQNHSPLKRTASNDPEPPKVASDNSTESTHKKRRRQPVQIPRIFLQHSPEMQSLESTLIQVNNYYAWRVSQTTDFFLSEMLKAGGHFDAAEVLDPEEVFNLMEDGMNAFAKGALQVAQDLLMRFCSKARTLLLQQHPRLIGNLIYYSAAAGSPPSAPIRTSIFSFLLDLARKVLGGNHPVLMVINMLQRPGALQKSLHLLVFKVLREVASNQGGSSSESVFDLDLDMVDVNAYQDDFQAALRFCQELLQRYIERLGDGHLYCRRLLRSLAHLHYCHGQDDEAEKVLLRILDLDASYRQNAGDADRVSVYAMEMLGWAFEARKNFSEAGKWYSQAVAAATSRWGSNHCATQRYLYQLNRVQAQLYPRRVWFDVQQTDNINVLEGLQREISRLGLEEVGDVEMLNHSKPWDDWDASTRGGSSCRNTDSPTNTTEFHSPPGDEASRRHEQSPHNTAMGESTMNPTQTIPMTDAMTTSDSSSKDDSMPSMTTSISPSETWSTSPWTEDTAPEGSSIPTLSDSPDIGEGDGASIDTLPVLGDNVDFDLMFSYLDESGDALSNGFFSCSDFQDWYALEGQDYSKDVYTSAT